MASARKRRGHRRKIINGREAPAKCPNCGRVMGGAWPFYVCSKDGIVELT